MKSFVSRLFAATLLLATMSFTAGAKEEPVEIRGSKGQLKGLLRVPDNTERCPLVILCHGLTSNKNSKLLLALADSLERKGIASVRFDYNGHGESEGDFVDMTVVNEVEDTYKIISYAESLDFVTKIGLLGHSQGGLVVGLAAPAVGADRISCLVLMAPGAIIKDGALSGHFLDAEFDPVNPPATMVFWKRTFGLWYIKTAQMLPIWEEAAKYQGKTLIVHGTGDDTVPCRYGSQYHEVMPGSELVLLDGLDHSFRKDRPAAVIPTVDFLVRCLK